MIDRVVSKGDCWCLRMDTLRNFCWIIMERNTQVFSYSVIVIYYMQVVTPRHNIQ